MKLKIKEKAVMVKNKAEKFVRDTNLVEGLVTTVLGVSGAAFGGYLIGKKLFHYTDTHLNAAVTKALEGKVLRITQPAISKDDLFDLEHDFITKAIEIFKEESKKR